MSATVEEVRAVLAAHGVTVEQAESRYGPLVELAACMSADEIDRFLTIAGEEKAAGRGRLPRGAPRVRLSPAPVRAGDVLRRDTGSAAVAADRAVTGDRAPCGPPPRGRSYKAQSRRRIADGGRRPSAWWLRGGSHSSDVRMWIAQGLGSPDPLEREIVRRLGRAAAGESGEITAASWRAFFPAAAAAFVLWYARTETIRPGFAGVVVGRPRGLLSLWSAHRFRGAPIHADNFSRVLGRLRPVLAGVLDYHQPSPGEAVRLGLPHSMHYRDGHAVPQAVNVYWWRDVAMPCRAAGPDVASGYGNCTENRAAGLRPTAGKESRAGPGTGPPPA